MQYESEDDDNSMSIVSEDIIFSDKFDLKSLSLTTLQEIHILHSMAINIEDDDDMEQIQDGVSINSKQHYFFIIMATRSQCHLPRLSGHVYAYDQ